ncbi:nucleoside diphosphate-linked moiety X motif 17-like [Neocloeon triangulifer]|uniref:nucleoside diphosphate-linked moiety X motif 17-like n=1 Tax=Neocloeon triangulifer TaxID=2078957 RepID=UPI00286EC600|nr:nucleoside diphosphate-linked moiety X motif 17-like [Neocloeon triangulifer]XP_059479653.1 nucleoside diphosphate-linked moiety X motif 17-like [Neocloeon triangulifer]
MNKTLVALRSCADGNSFVVAKFVDCLVHHFSGCNKDRVSVPVRCKLEDNLLKILPADPDDVGIKKNYDLFKWDKTGKKFTSDKIDHHVLLQHSRECPIGNLSDYDRDLIPADVQERGIDVAVSILLQSKDSRILMTRRPDHMRTFPKAWVPPGGHIEVNESLVEAGLRELKEETGLELGAGCIIQVLCLWESVYPFILGLGLPSRHHVVVYLLVKSDQTSFELTKSIKLDPEEVQACAWMSPESVKYLLDACEDPHQPNQEMFSLKEDGGLKSMPLIISSMFHPALWGKGEIYSGSQLALNLWYNSLCLGNNAKL